MHKNEINRAGYLHFYKFLDGVLYLILMEVEKKNGTF